MKPAVIVIDMVKDNLSAASDAVMSMQGRAIIPAVNNVTQAFRTRNLPVVFASDSFFPDDFIFKGKMKPHALRGTTGAKLAEELLTSENDVVVPKRRFSAFYKTDLDQTLRMFGVDAVALCGIATQFCVLSSAFDALSQDFQCVILEDCCASYDINAHVRTLDNYRRNPLYPLFQVMVSDEFLSLLET
jgi:nicotinamidase-related amidase